MKARSKSPRFLHLGFIASLALVLAAFEWTAAEWAEPAGWGYNATSLLEMEWAPVSAPLKPTPPPPVRVTPIITPDPAPPPGPAPDPNPDPLLGKIYDFGSYEEGPIGEEEDVETVLIAEHMPRFEDCTDVLDPDAERQCTEAAMIHCIQSCAVFPRHLVDAGVGGVVYLQFNVNEYGHIQDPMVLKSAHPTLDRSALQALGCIPPMIAGTQQGRPVRVTYTIPVRFTAR